MSGLLGFTHEARSGPKISPTSKSVDSYLGLTVNRRIQHIYRDVHTYTYSDSHAYIWVSCGGEI